MVLTKEQAQDYVNTGADNVMVYIEDDPNEEPYWMGIQQGDTWHEEWTRFELW